MGVNNIKNKFMNTLREQKTIYYPKVAELSYNLYQNVGGVKATKVNETEIIVSLTTIPSRINRVWITIETIMRQSVKPQKVILYLGKDKFKDVELPKKLLNQKKRGLEIVYCEDLICHTKYYYTVKNYSNSIVVTVDDDIIYPRYMLAKLIEVHKKYPDCIVCHRAHEITFNEDGSVKPYVEWGYESSNGDKPSHLLMQTGVSGVLYPPHSLHEEVLNIEKIKELCPRADDIWLKVMALKNGTKVVKAQKESKHFPVISETQEEALNKYNVANNGNDEQMKKLIKAYNLTKEDFYK